MWSITSILKANVNLRAPGHHFVAVNVGVWRTNVSVSGLYVHVVSKPRTFVPVENNKIGTAGAPRGSAWVDGRGLREALPG